jgi:hypothetical protein
VHRLSANSAARVSAVTDVHAGIVEAAVAAHPLGDRQTFTAANGRLAEAADDPLLDQKMVGARPPLVERERAAPDAECRAAALVGARAAVEADALANLGPEKGIGSPSLP